MMDTNIIVHPAGQPMLADILLVTHAENQEGQRRMFILHPVPIVAMKCRFKTISLLNLLNEDPLRENSNEV